MGALQFIPHKNGDAPSITERIIFGVFAAGLFACALHISLIFLRYTIIADVNGLRWRGAWGGWRAVPWDDVRDFYNEARIDTARTKSYVCPTIVTTSGIIKVSADCNNPDELRRMVRERATASRVADWDPLGVRRVDEWPRTFRYWDSTLPPKIITEAAITAAFLAAVGYAFVRMIIWYASVSSAAETRAVAIAMSVGYLVFLSLTVSRARKYLHAWERRGETITVTPETVGYANTTTGETLETSWGGVSDYFYRVRGGGFKEDEYALVLSGADENQIAWRRDVVNSELLLAIVQRYAPKPAFMRDENAVWRNKSVHEKTGGSDPATWSGGAVGMGGRVFTLKNATNAALLSFLCLFCIFLIVMCALTMEEIITGTEKDYRTMAIAVGMTSFTVVGTAYALACFFRVRVETDEIGITQYTVFGKKYLPWYAISDYRERLSPRSSNGNGNGFILVTGRNGTRITIWDTCNGFAELKDEIERYAPPPKTGWRKQPPVWLRGEQRDA